MIEIKAIDMLPEGDFAMTRRGDFSFITARDVVAHQIWLILSTKIGEWRFEPKYGIQYDNILRKFRNMKLYANENIRNEVQRGLYYVDKLATLDEITFKYSDDRNVVVSFKATMSDGSLLQGVKDFA